MRTTGPGWTLLAMALSLFTTLLWVCLGLFPLVGRRAGYPGSIEPIYVGLAASILVYGAGWLARAGAVSVPRAWKEKPS